MNVMFLIRHLCFLVRTEVLFSSLIRQAALVAMMALLSLSALSLLLLLFLLLLPLLVKWLAMK